MAIPSDCRLAVGFQLQHQGADFFVALAGDAGGVDRLDFMLGIPTPLWRGNDEGWKDNLQRAKQHLANHDDRAAGVYARSAFEGKLKKYCDKHRIPVPYRSNPAEMNSQMFWDAIRKKLTDEGKIATYHVQIADIETYRKVVLNPLSHEHPTTLTQAEIQGAITAIEELHKVLV